MYNLFHVTNRIVSLKFSAPTESSDFHNMMSFLRDELPKIGPIVLILETDGKGGFEPEQKREFSLWFKSNKSVLKENLFSLIRICSHVSVFSRISSKAFSAAMPCPYEVEDSLENAIALAEKILIKKGFNND